jgi:hypothetical protein
MFGNVGQFIYPKEIQGRKTKNPVGLLLLQSFVGKQRAGYAEIYGRCNQDSAVRQRDRKAIRAGKSWEIHVLQPDPSETKNIAKIRLERASELADKWERWNAVALTEK